MSARAAGLAAAVLAGGLSAAAPQDPAAAHFLESCAPCHTFGGGESAGPDLAGAPARSEDDLRAAVLRMQEHVGPLGPAQVDALVALMRDPAAAARLKKAEGATAPGAVEAGSPGRGEALFHGRVRLSGGGVACAACHRAEGGGGSLASDLTAAGARLGPTALVAASEKPPFPLMKAAYADAPITHAEAVDLAAFLSRADARKTPASEAGGVALAGAGAAAAALAALGLVYRRRNPGVRRKLVAREPPRAQEVG